jgi:hypothetical protein
MTDVAMKRFRLKRYNFQIRNKMSKENKTSDKPQNGNDFIADVMPSLHSEPKTKDDMLLEILSPLGTEIPDPTGEYADLLAYLYDKISPLLSNEA